MADRLERLKAELERRKQMETQIVESDRLAQLRAALAQKESPPPAQPDEGFNWARALAEAAAQGAYSHTPPGRFEAMMPAEDIEYQEQPINQMPQFIQTQEPETAAQRIATTGLRTGTAAFTAPGGAVFGAAPSLAGGVASGALQETGMPEWLADILGMTGGPQVLSKLASVAKATPKVAGAIWRAEDIPALRTPRLSTEETAVAKHLQKVIPEKDRLEAIENLAAPKEFPVTGYKPTSAEIAEVPAISQYERLRYEMPESGLASHRGEQNTALRTAAAQHTPNAASTPELQSLLNAELKNARAVRREATEPGFAALRKDETQINPVNAKKFVKENKNERGELARRIEEVGKNIQPSKKLTTQEKAQLRKYNSSMTQYNAAKADLEATHFYNPKNKQEALEALPKPKISKPNIPHPTTAELTGAKAAISRLKRKYQRTGEEQLATIMGHAESAVEKDLSKVPLHAETMQKWAKLSEPVYAVTQHDVLKKIPKSRRNNLYDYLYTTKESPDNIAQLKKVLGKNSKDWEQFQHGTIDYMVNKIGNAGAEGKGNVISYDKFNNFLKAHKDALKTALSSEQMELIDEFRRAIHGKNIANSLGAGRGSPTHARLATDLGLRTGIGEKVLNATSYLPYGKTRHAVRMGLAGMLRFYHKHRDANMMKAFDVALKEPKVMHKLLSHKFDTQREFNEYMKKITSRATTARVVASKRNEEENHD